jgi:hypothetical protein
MRSIYRLFSYRFSPHSGIVAENLWSLSIQSIAESLMDSHTNIARTHASSRSLVPQVLETPPQECGLAFGNAAAEVCLETT